MWAWWTISISRATKWTLSRTASRHCNAPRAAKFDAIVLDLILPGRDGLSVCRELRERGIDTPVLMLTAKMELQDMLRGYSVGADDYLTKPFRPSEMLARLRALLKRGVAPSETDTSGGESNQGLYVDCRRGLVWLAGKPLKLTSTEHALLLYFAEHPAEPLSRERLLREVWDSRLEDTTRTVDAHIASLRKKVEDDPESPRRIRTVCGEGYEFVPD